MSNYLQIHSYIVCHKGSAEDEEKLSKGETEVAKHLRWNLATKKSSLYGDEVYYFTGLFKEL